jgi:hypothetical protein
MWSQDKPCSVVAEYRVRIFDRQLGAEDRAEDGFLIVMFAERCCFCQAPKCGHEVQLKVQEVASVIRCDGERCGGWLF